MPDRPRILSISFSEFVSDARVLRQLGVLADYGDVTTIGYGPKPPDASEHLQLVGEPASLPQTPAGVLMLALHLHRKAELAAPANVAALALLADKRFDLVVANEARALPLAHAVAHGAPVWGDMHEWAPEERTQILSWRLLVAPLMRSICARYLPRTEAVSTVNGSIAAMYQEQFGCEVRVVRNAIALQDLAPSPVTGDRVRLVHSGSAVPGRSIERLIEATRQLDERFTLDLFLVAARDGGRYLDELRGIAGEDDRIVFHEAVAPGDLPRTLNAYDIGVFVLPPHTANHRFMLPNKFFDFVQARLGVVFSPAIETSALIERYDLGRVSPDFTASSLAETLQSLTADDVRRYKRNADNAAAALSSEQDEQTQRDVIGTLLKRTVT
ncbi:MAG TPA: hypothetical protein VN133_00445 [Humibacter sp.]|nr:hypothetical protein [Humibacter sp.]